MDRTNQTVSTPTRGGKFRKFLLGLGVLAVAGVTMSAAPAMANERGDDRGRVERHERIEEFRHDHRFIQRDVCDRVWVPARYEFRTIIDCGRTVTQRVCVEVGHWVIR